MGQLKSADDKVVIIRSNQFSFKGFLVGIAITCKLVNPNLPLLDHLYKKGVFM